MFKFKAEKFSSEELLGTSTSGNVYPYQRNRFDQRWAVKHLMVKDTNSLLQIMNNIVLRFKYSNPNMIPIKGYFVEPMNPKGFQIFIKMPRMKENLDQLIKRLKKEEGKVQEEKIVKWLYSLLKGLQYLHRNKISHGDIKPSKLLVDQEDEIKLGNIRAIKGNENVEESFGNYFGTHFYLAPEIMNEGYQVRKKDYYLSDIWSLGLSIAELCLLKTWLMRPHEPNKEKVVEKILEEIRERYSQELIDIIKLMLEVDPLKRGCAKDLLNLLEEKYKNILNLNKDISSQNSDINEEFMKEIELTKKKYVQDISELKKLNEKIMKENEELQKSLQTKKQEVLKLKTDLGMFTEQKYVDKDDLSQQQNDLLKLILLKEQENQKLKDILLLEHTPFQNENDDRSKIIEKENKWFKMIKKLQLNDYLFIESERYLQLRIKTKEFQNKELQKFLQKLFSKLNEYESLIDLEMEFNEHDHELMSFLSSLRVSDKLTIILHQKVVAYWLFNGNWTAKKIEKTIGPNFRNLRKFDFLTDHQFWSQTIKGVSKNLPKLEELSLSIRSCVDDELVILSQIVLKRLKKLKLLKLKSESIECWLPYKGVLLFASNFGENDSTISIEISGKFLNDQSPSDQELSEFAINYPRIKLISYFPVVQQSLNNKKSLLLN